MTAQPRESNEGIARSIQRRFIDAVDKGDLKPGFSMQHAIENALNEKDTAHQKECELLRRKNERLASDYVMLCRAAETEHCVKLQEQLAKKDERIKELEKDLRQMHAERLINASK